MHHCKRATGVVLASAVIGSGLSLGFSTTAHAAPAVAPASVSTVASSQQLPVLGGLLSVVTDPLLSGSGAVGSLITLTDPVWNLLSGVTNSYQWLRDGVPIVGATGSTYLPTAEDAGHQITALVSGSLLGVLPVSVLTNALTIPLSGGVGGGGGGGGGGGLEPGSLFAAVLPLLQGTPVVGGVLTMLPTTWSLPGVTTSVQWLSNGVPILGATGSSLPLTGDLLGSDISAVVTGAIAGLPLVSVITSALGVSSAADAIVAELVPSLTGGGLVGTVLSGSAPTWSVEGVTTAYQWLRNGAPIPGATTQTYTLTNDDAAKQIAMKATGTKGSSTGTATSAPVVGKLAELLTNVTKPVLGGSGKVGGLLNVAPGVWNGLTQPVFGYQWFANGKAISGATGSQYVVKAADAGRSLAVLVTATRAGTPSASAATDVVEIAKIGSRTVAKTLKKQVQAGRAALMKLTISSSGSASAGKVAVVNGKKLLKIFTVRSNDNGTRIVKLPKLKRGKHSLLAVFLGNATQAPSVSKATVLKVANGRTDK
ncbi:MAG: hypothetical protein WB767_00570 [Nocardioides sp.]